MVDGLAINPTHAHLFQTKAWRSTSLLADLRALPPERSPGGSLDGIAASKSAPHEPLSTSPKRTQDLPSNLISCSWSIG